MVAALRKPTNVRITTEKHNNMKYLALLSIALFWFTSCDKDETEEPDTTTETPATGTFTLSSAAVENGLLLDDFKCEEKTDGKENSIPLAWSNVPTNTVSLAVTMVHYPNPDDLTKPNCYLVLWGIDADVTEIAYGAGDDGPWFMGTNKDGNNVSYTSPCSPSTGSHEYTIAITALDALPSTLPSESTVDVDYATLQEAMGTVNVLGTAELTFDSVTE